MTQFWRLKSRYRAAILTLAGVFAGLGQAPTDLWPLTLIAFAFGFVAAQTAPSPKHWVGIWFWIGVGYFAVSLRWIIEPFLVDIATHGWMAPFAIVFMSCGGALFWALAAYLASKRGGIIALMAALAGAEALRSLILTGFPWALAGHIWIGTPIAQVAAFTGPHGLSLITFAISASLATAVKGQNTGWIVPISVVGLWPLLAPGPAADASPEDKMVRIVHPNIPQQDKWDPVLRAQNFHQMLALSEGEARADLIVWPESAITQLLENAEISLESLSERAAGVPVITGIQRRSHDRVFHNSLIVLGRGGEVQSVYDKQHLVPFGEYVPAGEIAARLGISHLASSQGFGFTPGQGAEIVNVEGIGAIRPLICYEGIFAEEVRGSPTRPDLMVLLSNDGWFGTGPGPLQHLEQAQLRSIELGVPMVRAVNSGISAVIDGKGRITAQKGLDQTGKLEAAIPPVLPQTLYDRTGDLPCLLLIGVLAVWPQRSRHQISIDAKQDDA